MTSIDQKHRGGLLVVFLVVFVDLLGFGMVLPLVPVYAKQFTAGYSPMASNAILGLLMVCFSVMQFFFNPVWGRFSDRYGRRPIILLGLAGSTFFYFLFGVATQQGSLTWMFISRIGAGITGATIPTAQAYIADVTPPERRTRGMALIGAAFGLGFTFGPLLGAAALWIASEEHAALSPWPGYVAAAFSGLALCLAWFLLSESYAPQTAARADRRLFDWEAFRDAMFRRPVGLVLVAATLAVFALAGFEATLSVTLADLLQLERAGAKILLVFTFIGLVQTLVQGLLVRPLSVRVSEAFLGYSGLLIAGIGFSLIAAFASGPSASAAMIVVGSGIVAWGLSFVQPALHSLLSRRTSVHRQGRIFGLATSLSAIARIVGVMVAFQVRTISPGVPFWSATVLMVITGVVLAYALPESRAASGDPTENADSHPADLEETARVEVGSRA